MTNPLQEKLLEHLKYLKSYYPFRKFYGAIINDEIYTCHNNSRKITNAAKKAGINQIEIYSL